MAIEPQFEMALCFKGLGFRVDALQQVEACFQGRRFLLRSELTGHASQAVRAAGVAFPTLRVQKLHQQPT
jgi:hypothetical protein